MIPSVPRILLPGPLWKALQRHWLIYNAYTDGWTRPSKCNLVKKVD